MRTLRRYVAGMLAAGIVASGTTASRAAGAIAVGPCGAYGYAYDFVREPEATQAALAKCTGGCKVIAVRRACGAIAVDLKDACGAHGYAVAPRLGNAQNNALRQCYESGGKDCVIRAWACDAKG